MSGYIDTHLHVNFHGQSSHDVINAMDATGVACGILVTWEEARPGNPHYQHVSLQDVMAAFKEYPDRLSPMFAPDPAAEDAVERLGKAAPNIVGCGELKTSMLWADSRLDSYLDAVERFKLPLVFHMESPGNRLKPSAKSGLDLFLRRLHDSPRLLGVPAKVITLLRRHIPAMSRRFDNMHLAVAGYLQDFEGLEQRLVSHPNITFIGHGPLFWQGLDADWQESTGPFPKGKITQEGITCDLLHHHPNLCADLSAQSGYNALARDKTFARRFLMTFQDRLLYGTDNMDLGLLELLKAFDLPKDVFMKIVRLNAMRLFPGIANQNAAHKS